MSNMLSVILCSYFVLSCAKNISEEYTPIKKSDVTITDFTNDIKWKRLNQINWQIISSFAFHISVKKEKPILLYIYKDNCRECQNLELKTFSNPNIINKINKKLIPIAINVDIFEMPPLPTVPRKYPTLYFIPPYDTFHMYIDGYIKPSTLEKVIDGLFDKSATKDSVYMNRKKIGEKHF